MKDYQFKHNPSLMQKLAVYQLKKNHHYANWCGTGAGKTNSALIATRETNARVTIIICPNSVKQSWIDAINAIYPNNTNIINYHSSKDIVEFDRTKFNYIIINYEKFSVNNKNQGKPMIDKLLSLNKIDFICIDEIQFAKSCSTTEGSNRRECIKFFRLEAEKQNPELYVYGMTATPVINTIAEAQSLIELITGKEHPEIGNIVTVNNCYQANKWLSIIGFRFIPNYGINVDEKFININGDELAEDIVRSNGFIGIESILVDKKLHDENVIKELTPGTIVYCQYKKEIINKIIKRFDELGISFVKYTGDENNEMREYNKKLFINKKTDILLASSPISTGVNGLQEISNKIIVISYPWTGAEWDQLIGRINRQGSAFDKVTIVHPHVYISTNTGEWNYDERRWNIIKNKKTLSDAVVDGHIDSIYKLNRNKFIKEIKVKLIEGNIDDFHVERNDIKVKYEFTEQEYEKSKSIIMDVHRKANTSTSEHMHEWFVKHPEDWKKYHKQREITKSKWDEDPVDIIANEINKRNDTNVIADLGCGLAKLSTLISKPNKVISVDHVANNENIIEADMANLHEHIKDNEIDITVFCLSLWGTNYLDYIKEAYRITGKRGLMYIVEPNNEFDFDKLKNDISKIGFNKINETIRGKFTYLTFIKN